MNSIISKLQLLNNTEHRVKFKTGSDISNALIQPVTTHALSFNGTDQHGIISDLEINGAFTISMWVKLKDYQSSVSVYSLFHKDYVSQGTTDIFLDIGNARLRAQVYDRTGSYPTSITHQFAWQANLYPNDTWHHVMMTYDGTANDSAIKTFINGVESTINVMRNTYNESSFNSVNSPADTDAYIGWSKLNNRRFKGEMDQIAIWNSDQSSNISSIYTGNSPADLTSLSPDHLFELNNNTNNSTGASTLSLYGGGEFKPTLLPTLKDPLVGELLLDKTGDIGGVNLDGETRIDTDYTYNGSGEITGSLWIKTNSSKKFIILTDSQSGGYESRFAFGLNGDGNFYVLLGNSGGQQVVHKTSPSSNSLNDGQWHHLVYRVDSSNEATVWVDGVLNATHQINFAIDNSIHVTSYGSGWPDGTAPVYDTWGFEGQLKGLGVWETALTNQQINTIFMSGMDSSVPYESLSPNVWVGPTGPALYNCTDTSGTISKVSGNIKKMGDVPMLKINQQQFASTGTFTTHSNFAYSFWFYDDGVGTGEHFLIQNNSVGQNRIKVNHDTSQLILEQHGDFDGTCDSNHGPNCAHFFDNSIVTPNGTHANLKYEKYKLNHLLVVKKGGTIAPTHVTGSCWIYLNGKLVASIIEAAYHTYPSTTFMHKINHENTMQEMMLGDVAYWNEDVTGIVDEIFDPIGAHKGQQGNLMNLSIQPYHYWKLGFPMQDGEIKDIGSDGTNHLTSRRPIEETYSTSVYQNDSYHFTPQDGVMYSLPNEESNPSAGSNVSYGHPTKFIINLNGSEVETVTWNSTNNRWEGSTRYISLQVVASGKRWQIRQITNGAAQAFGNIFSGSGDSELSNSPVDSTYSNGYSVADDNSDYYDPEMFMFTGDTINITRPDSSHPLHIKDSNGNDVAVPNISYSSNSLSFDGSGDYLDLGSGFTTTNQFTISAWIKPDDLSTTGYGYLVGNNPGTGISLDEGGGAAGPGKFYLWTGSGTVDVLSTTALTINNWFHVVFVCDKTVGAKGEIKFYLNGSLDKTTTLSNQDLKSILLLSYVGRSGSHYFNGQVDEVAIFNSALSSSDVTAIYNNGVTSDISSLNPTHWWSMGDNDSGSGTTITDQGSGGNDGTLVGGPTFSTDVPGPPYIATTFSPTIAGTYQYYCTSHSSMIGNINVLQREGYENIFGIDRSTES